MNAMVKRNMRASAVMVMALVCAACGSSKPAATAGGGGTAATLPEGAACVLKSPALDVGASSELTIDGVTYTKTHQPDAPGPLELPATDAGAATGTCANNDQFRFGTGIYDTTGPIGGNPTGHADMFGMVVPPQEPNGIHQRLYARAFAIESPCNDKRVMFVSLDLGAVSGLLHQEILKKIADDPQLAGIYTRDNLMVSATHTHTAGGGFGVPVLPDLSSTLPTLVNNPAVWVESLIFSNANYDDDNVNAIVDGTVQAIRRAHVNLEAHPQTAGIRMAIDELLNANINRTPPGYKQNSPSERAQYVDADGHEVNVSKRSLQLNFVRDNGSVAGILNWFPVHPTSMGNHALLLSGDNKGYASLGFEKLMGTRYQADVGQLDGSDNFVAGFAQADEGDTIPDLFVFDADPDGGNGPGEGVPYFARGGTNEPYEYDQPGFERGQPESTAISGTKQLAMALEQMTRGTALHGPIDYRFFYADFSNDEITDPVVLAELGYGDLPSELYDGDKTTCTTAMGVGFGVGGVNGPGFGAAGFTCVDDAPVPYTDEIRNGYNGLYNGTGYVTVKLDDQNVKVPFPGVEVYTVAAPALCLATALQPGYSCQREKPVLVSAETNPVPFQLLRIGNLAVLGVPFEVTTMSGRRIRKTVLDVLKPIGVDTVVIAGPSNDYLHYLATREEYSAQMYEGSSTYAGPWELAAVQQESRRLALTMAAGEPAPEGIPAGAFERGPASQIFVDPDSDFGAVLTDAADSYTQGDIVDVTFVAGYPGHDLKLMGSYLYVERQNAQGGWDVIATDRDGELLFLWDSDVSLIDTELGTIGPSTVEARWTIPANMAPGTYRIRHDGSYRLSKDQAPQAYKGISKSFAISGTPAACP
ncbi:hypothetical protein E4T66_15715 [Sinimarinibacterium sp. CAU 1509]|nr:hypothetical protein E4T66_15715 [Sinimarinibacterium sp. CAU 1509]